MLYTSASFTSDRCRWKFSVLNPESDQPCWLHEQHVLTTSSYDPTRSPGLSSFVCSSVYISPELTLHCVWTIYVSSAKMHHFTLLHIKNQLPFPWPLCQCVQVRLETFLVEIIRNTVHNFGIVRTHVYKGSNHIRHIINVTDEKHWELQPKMRSHL